jgi:hypothetical protein
LVNRTECAAAELFCDRVRARRVFIDNAYKFYGAEFAGELVIDAGMVSSKGAYADNGNANGI